MAAVKKLWSYLWPVSLHRTSGEISSTLEVSYENGKKVLNAGTVNYSFGALHEVFQVAFQKIRLADEPPASVLILGFGAGSVASIIRNELKLNSALVGVDADKKVIDLAISHFGLSQIEDLEMVHAYAEEFVMQCQLKFDLIVVDLFVEDEVPASCRTSEFFTRLKELLNKDGKVVFNEMPTASFGETDQTDERFKKVFETNEVIELRLGNSPNRVLVGYNIY